MQLIKLLQEASSLPISSLKKTIQKDPRVAPVLKKGVKLEDIPDLDSFLSTLKYYLLNNDNVKKFVDARHNVKDLHRLNLKDFRMLRKEALTQSTLDSLAEFIGFIFKEHGSVERRSISSETRKALSNWCNNNSKSAVLPSWATAELKSIPDIRPDKRIVLYRGVLFSSYDLKNNERYDGTLEKGNGVKFLQSLKKGGKEVDLNWHKASSWTKSKSIAQQFAMYGPASSHGAAMLNWFQRGSAGKFIDGDLGYVISTFADPDDIIVDLTMMNGISSQHSDEAEVIMAAGTYPCRVVNKYTVTGEVDPTTSVDDSAALSIIGKFNKMGDIIKLPELDLESDYLHWLPGVNVVRDKSMFSKLANDRLTTQLVDLVDKLNKYFQDNISNADKSAISADKLAHNEELLAKSKMAKAIMADFENVVDRTKKLKYVDLSGEEIRSRISIMEIDRLQNAVKNQSKLGYSETHALEMLMQHLKLDTNTVLKEYGINSLNRVGHGKLKPLVDRLTDEFFAHLNITKPSEDATNVMFNLIRKACRNLSLFTTLRKLKKTIEGKQ